MCKIVSAGVQDEDAEEQLHKEKIILRKIVHRLNVESESWELSC